MKNKSLFSFSGIMIATFVMLTISPASALAADNNTPFSFRPSGQYISSADVGDGDGSMAVTTGRMDLRWKFLSLSYSQSNYTWDNVDALAFGNGRDDPWEKLHRIALGVNFRDDINEDWFYHTGLTLTSSFENEIDGSLGGVLRGGLGYKINDNIRAMAGVALMANNLRTTIMPTIGLSYEGLDDDGSGWSGFLGFPSFNSSYHFDKTTALRFSIESQGQTARLANDSTVAAKGYTKISGWQSGLYFDWEPTELVRFSFGPEYSFGRSITLYNEHGDELYDENVGSAFGAALKFSIAF